MVEDFARNALRGTTTDFLNFEKLPKLIDAMLTALKEAFPDTDASELVRYVDQGLLFVCPSCGLLDTRGVLTSVAGRLVMDDSPELKLAGYGGPNVAALAEGMCPGCFGQTVGVCFFPSRIEGFVPLPNDDRGPAEETHSDAVPSAGSLPEDGNAKHDACWYCGKREAAPKAAIPITLFRTKSKFLLQTERLEKVMQEMCAADKAGQNIEEAAASAMGRGFNPNRIMDTTVRVPRCLTCRKSHNFVKSAAALLAGSIILTGVLAMIFFIALADGEKLAGIPATVGWLPVLFPPAALLFSLFLLFWVHPRLYRDSRALDARDFPSVKELRSDGWDFNVS